MPRVSARVDTRIYAPCVYTRIHIVYTRARICMFIRHAIARVSLLSDTDTRHSWTPSKSYQTINPAHICPDYLCTSTTQNQTFVNKIIVGNDLIGSVRERKQEQMPQNPAIVKI